VVGVGSIGGYGLFRVRQARQAEMVAREQAELARALAAQMQLQDATEKAVKEKAEKHAATTKGTDEKKGSK
jgi:hypothetical protein